MSMYFTNHAYAHAQTWIQTHNAEEEGAVWKA